MSPPASPDPPGETPSPAVAKQPAARGKRTRLLLVKASLALILLGMLMVGRRNGIWPVINWPMYARAFEAPPPVATEMRVDVLTADGRRAPFMMREFAPTGEHKEVAAVFLCSQQNPDPSVRAQCARAIDALARRSVPGQEVAAVEMWEVSWNTDVFALPPLDRDRPDAQWLVGRIEARDAAKVSTR
jgi:hypothetical protein